MISLDKRPPEREPEDKELHGSRIRQGPPKNREAIRRKRLADFLAKNDKKTRS